MTKSGKWKVLHPEDLVQTGAAGTINNPGQTGGGKETTNLGKVDVDEDEDKPKVDGDEEPSGFGRARRRSGQSKPEAKYSNLPGRNRL